MGSLNNKSNRRIIFTWRALGFRIVAIGLGLMPIVLFETALRWANYGQRDGQNRNDAAGSMASMQPLFTLDPSTSMYRIDQAWLTHFNEASFPANKSPASRRIFVVGGSTVQGRPYRTQTAFSSWLQIGLTHSDAQHDWQVVNCGGVSYASYRLVPMVRELLGHRPDAIIVYTGNNEFLERCSFYRQPSVPARLLQQANRLRVVQFANEVVHGRDDSQRRDSQRELTQPDASHRGDDTGTDAMRQRVDALLDHQGGLAAYERDVPSRAATSERMVDSLQAIIDMCQRSSVPLIVCCPAVNQVDCPPFKTQFSDSLSETQRDHVDRLLNQSIQANRGPSQRLEGLTLAQSIDPENPDIAYRRGRLLLERGRTQQAAIELQKAIDYDICPLRCRGPMQQAIRTVAHRNDVILADVDALFRSLHPDGLIGRNIMVDHVHPSIHGHQLIAQLLLQKLQLAGVVTQVAPTSDLKLHFANHLTSLDESYFARGRQRLEGLQLWAAGRVGDHPSLPSRLHAARDPRPSDRE